MQATILLVIALTGAGGGEYSRPLGSGRLDQPTLDAEAYGETKALHREADGLRVVVAPGVKETGWKTPQQMRFGGDFTLSAGFVVKKLPKPAIEDGVAIGLAIAYNDVTQPDVTFIRLVETTGADVYRTIDKASANPQQMQMQNQMMMMQMRMGGMVMMGGMQPGGKQPKPPRKTFPAAGESFRLELQREGQVVRFQVLDGRTSKPRYLGQLPAQGPMDVAAVKLFVVNRNGAEPIDVLFKDFKLRADRITGLGAIVRSVFGEVVYGEPTAIDDGRLVIGGAPTTPAAGAVANQAVSMPTTTPAAALVAAQAAARVQAVRMVAVRPAGVVVVRAAPAVVAAPPAQVIAPVAAQAPAVNAAASANPTPPKQPADVFAADASPSAVFADPSGQAAQAAAPKPKARIPLDEIESIKFERTPTLTARLIGQPNLDFTRGAPPADDPAKKPDDAAKKTEDKKPDGSDDVAAPAPGTTVVQAVKIDAGKNGIRDLQIGLFGLRPSKIRQITINCQTDTGATTWQSGADGAQGWPLVVHRAGTEISADLFLEPPPGDCHQKSFTINVMYEDNQNANVNFQADKHSDPKLAVDPKTPGAEALDAWVYLTGDEKLFGKLGDVVDDKLHLATPWNDQLEIPLSRIAAVHVGLLDRKETPESFARRMKARGAEDLLLAQTRKGEVVAIAGVLEGIKGDRLNFLYQGKSRSLPVAQVEGLIVAARPEPRPDELRPSFLMEGDVAVSGRWKGLDATVWKVEAPWGQEMKLPAPSIHEVRFRGGKMTYLSDLEPSKVEEASYFGHRFPWRRDVGLTGDPIKMNGETYARGIAVHSRSSLTYDLDGRFATFEALVGFDDAARGKGRVACRVFADGEEIYNAADLRGDAPPTPLKLPVASVRQLRLEVDYGRGQDTGDRVIWADARLYCATEPKAEAAASR